MKGQISLDFIIAVIAAIVLIASLSAIINDLKETQNETILFNQAKEISLEVARIASLSESLEQYDYEIRYFIPEILNLEGLPEACNIKIESEKVIVSVSGITAETPVIAPDAQFECGSQMVITNA
ncbi:MAG: hypothetical protein ABIA76_03190 [Candidatus Diapherotrites archaeon]